MVKREPENHVIARTQQDLPSALAKFYAHYVCLDAVSCDVRGELTLDNHTSQPCTEPGCVTLKTLHTVFLYARSTRCNAVDLGAGTLQLYNLVTAFQRDGNGRGVHRGSCLGEPWDRHPLPRLRRRGRCHQCRDTPRAAVPALPIGLRPARGLGRSALQRRIRGVQHTAVPRRDAQRRLSHRLHANARWRGR